MEKDCGAWINLLSRMVKKRLNTTLQGLGITAIQSRVIFYILDHYQQQPVFQRDIESAFQLSRSTATGILQQLEKKGILRRESVASDARLKSLVPTEQAAELGCQAGGNARVARECGYIFLGVKPQMMAETLDGIADILAARQTPFVLVSMAAGLSMARIRQMDTGRIEFLA